MPTIKTLRSDRTHELYQGFLKKGGTGGCYLCKAMPVKEYKHWKIVENEYPYDEVAETNHLVTPKRHSKEGGITKAAAKEYKRIKEELHGEYDAFLENTNGKKSIPEHHHTHLLRLKPRETHKETKPAGLRAGFLAAKSLWVAR